MFLANYIMVGIVILVLVTFSILILCGKGDSLIAGYNTADEEDKAGYDIGRLRKVTGYGQLAICLPTGFDADGGGMVNFVLDPFGIIDHNHHCDCHPVEYLRQESAQQQQVVGKNVI